MENLVKLNILDQSPVFDNETYEESLSKTIELAQFADENHFSRFWVSEHHNTRSFASASPEILIPVIASKTKKIRVGSAGVLLSHYSPIKIAEQFHLLEAIFENRIDLGIGRASGADVKTLKHLKSGMLNQVNSFNEIDQLIDFLKNKKTVKAMPEINHNPEIWVLGTSPESAKYAGERGLPYCFGSFINPLHEFQAIQTYYNYFQASEFCSQPYLNLAVFALINENETTVNEASLSVKRWFIESFIKKNNIFFPNQKNLKGSIFTSEEEMILKQFLSFTFIGTAREMIPNIEKKIRDYKLNELTIVTICEDFELKKSSYLQISKGLRRI